MKRIERILSPLLAVSLTIVLSACGFQLRGVVDIAPGLQNLSVQGDNQVFRRLLLRSLERTGITVSESAPYTIDILAFETDEKLGSSSSYITADYDLTVTATWQMTDTFGNVLIPPREVSQLGTYQGQTNEFNAIQNARQNLLNNLQESLARLMTRNIATITSDELQARISEAAARPQRPMPQPVQ